MRGRSVFRRKGSVFGRMASFMPPEFPEEKAPEIPPPPVKDRDLVVEYVKMQTKAPERSEEKPQPGGTETAPEPPAKRKRRKEEGEE